VSGDGPAHWSAATPDRVVTMPRPKRRDFTPDEDAELARLRGQGMSFRAIATVMNRGHATLQDRWRRLSLRAPGEGEGGTLRRFTEAERQRLIAEYWDACEAGRGRELAKEMGRTPAFLAGKAKELGLTTYRRKRAYNAEKTSKYMKEWHARNDHPKGFRGRNHSDKSKTVIGGKSLKSWAGRTEEQRSDLALKMVKTRVDRYGTAAPPRLGTSWKAEWRTIGGERSFYRSMWEANYARYLEWLRVRGEIKTWEHEPKTFWFEAIRRGTRSYLPDFRVTENNGAVIYHEVKGWMDDRSKTKINRMRIYYPDVKLIIIDARGYRAIMRQAASLVPGWETAARADPHQGTLFEASLKPSPP
jgi:transposase-like protein